MKQEEGEPLPSSNDLPLHNRDDCLMLPHRFTSTKKCIMLHLHKTKVYFYLKTKNILALTWQKSAILVAFIFSFKPEQVLRNRGTKGRHCPVLRSHHSILWSLNC